MVIVKVSCRLDTGTYLYFLLFQELVTFAKYVLNRFFAVAAKNNKAYIELLFWKNVGAAREMTEGYTKDGFVLFVFYW